MSVNRGGGERIWVKKDEGKKDAEKWRSEKK